MKSWVRGDLGALLDLDTFAFTDKRQTTLGNGPSPKVGEWLLCLRPAEALASGQSLRTWRCSIGAASVQHGARPSADCASSRESNLIQRTIQPTLPTSGPRARATRVGSSCLSVFIVATWLGTPGARLQGKQSLAPPRRTEPKCLPAPVDPSAPTISSV